MQFQIPQFIDVEDKIFGPFTFKQFVYLGGGFGIAFVLYKLLPLFIALFFIAPILVLSFALSFYKINERPFIFALESAFKFSLKEKLYLWRKKEKTLGQKEAPETVSNDLFVPRLSESKLKDLAWSLDVQESIYAGQDARNKEV